MTTPKTCYRCGDEVAADSQPANDFGYLCGRCHFEPLTDAELASLRVPTPEEVDAALEKGRKAVEKARAAQGSQRMSNVRFR